MDQITEHPFINDLSEKLTSLDVVTYFKDLEQSDKNYYSTISDTKTTD